MWDSSHSRLSSQNDDDQSIYICTFVFTNSPTAIVQAYPACIRVRAIIIPVDPDEQLLLTLKTGTPVKPRPGK